jgi:hypothetical protein
MYVPLALPRAVARALADVATIMWPLTQGVVRYLMSACASGDLQLLLA